MSGEAATTKNEAWMRAEHYSDLLLVSRSVVGADDPGPEGVSDLHPGGG